METGLINENEKRRSNNISSKGASFIIGNVTGMAAAIAKDVYGYYFGSSKGEREATSKSLFSKK
jgi:hypothetical protein